MFFEMMALLLPDALVKLREVNRESVLAFAEYQLENRSEWPFVLKCATSTDENATSPEGNAASHQSASVAHNGKLLDTAPFLIRTPILRAAARRRRGAASHWKSGPPAVSLALSIEVNDLLQTFGACRDYRTDSTQYLIPSKALPQVDRLAADRGVVLGEREFPTARLEQGKPHCCREPRHPQCEPPLLLTLASPPMEKRISKELGTNLTITVSADTMNTSARDEDDCHSGGVVASPKFGSSMCNTVPSYLADVLFSSHTRSLQHDPTSTSSLPTSHNWGQRRAAWEDVYSLHDVAPVYRRFGMSCPALTAAYLNLRRDRNYNNRDPDEQLNNYCPPFDVLCAHCRDAPIPVVWKLAPNFLSCAVSTANVGTRQPPYQPVPPHLRICVDLSSLRHVATIGVAFLSRSWVTEVRLPHMLQLPTDGASNGTAPIPVRYAMDGPGSVLWTHKFVEDVVEDELALRSLSSNMKKSHNVDGNVTQTISSVCVGDEFLNACIFLSSIDLLPLQGVQIIRDQFMRGCINLKSVDLEPLGAFLTEIGCWFLSDCVSLRQVDLTSLVRVREYPRGFLSGCSALEQVTFPSPVKGAATLRIGSRFMAGCTSVREVDLRPLGSAIEGVPLPNGVPSSEVFDGCAGLRKVLFGGDVARRHIVGAMSPEIRFQIGEGVCKFM